jgi:mRNA interferase RelE/StbE
VYEIYFERAAERDLRRLSEETFHRIVPRIRALAENPRPPGCRKLTGAETIESSTRLMKAKRP